jgi:hypothetical protein
MLTILRRMACGYNLYACRACRSSGRDWWRQYRVGDMFITHDMFDQLREEGFIGHPWHGEHASLYSLTKRGRDFLKQCCS